MASQQVNAAKLKSTGVNLTNLAAKMKSEMNKLDENIQKVSSVWSGEASASYLKRVPLVHRSSPYTVEYQLSAFQSLV